VSNLELDAPLPPTPITDVFAVSTLEIRIVVDASFDSHRIKATLDGVPQAEVETSHIDDLLSALATVYGDHMIAARDECQTLRLIEVR
jgi:hypothetical protein